MVGPSRSKIIIGQEHPGHHSIRYVDYCGGGWCEGDWLWAHRKQEMSCQSWYTERKSIPPKINILLLFFLSSFWTPTINTVAPILSLLDDNVSPSCTQLSVWGWLVFMAIKYRWERNHLTICLGNIKLRMVIGCCGGLLDLATNYSQSSQSENQQPSSTPKT